MEITNETNLVIHAINEVPEGDLWGIVIYFYVTPSGKLAYEYSGSYNEFENPEHIIDEDFATFEKLKKDIEELQEHSFFSTSLNYIFGTHTNYHTECVRISKKIGKITD